MDAATRRKLVALMQKAWAKEELTDEEKDFLWLAFTRWPEEYNEVFREVTPRDWLKIMRRVRNPLGLEE